MILALALLAAAATGWQQQTVTLQGETLSGAAATDAGSPVTWGSHLRVWDSHDLKSIVVAEGPFGEGGCVIDKGRTFISVRGTGPGDLLAIELASGKQESIDTEVEMHDCLEATLFGRTGFVMVHRGMQIRFYVRGPEGWKSRDVYSIYTPSYQTGLGLADVDGDGLTDIFCGNYWLQSPKTFEESWRLFAINTWFEGPRSASMRIAVLSPERIVVAQAHENPARMSRFDAPANRREQWHETSLARDRDLTNVHGLGAVGSVIIAGERNGRSSRLMAVDARSGTVEVIAQGTPVLAVVPLSTDAFAAAGPHSLTIWRQPRRR